MKKKVVKAAVYGAWVGIAMSTLIPVFISLCIGDGTYYPVVPHLIPLCGSEWNAVLFQLLGCAVMGIGMAAGGCIFAVERWSLLKQTLLHFAVMSISLLPLSYLLQWMPRDVLGIVLYFGIFLAIYVLIWICKYFAMRKTIRRINDKIGK